MNNIKKSENIILNNSTNFFKRDYFSDNLLIIIQTIIFIVYLLICTYIKKTVSNVSRNPSQNSYFQLTLNPELCNTYQTTPSFNPLRLTNHFAQN